MRHKTIVISIEFIIIIYLQLSENNYYIFDLAITAQIQKNLLSHSMSVFCFSCLSV